MDISKAEVNKAILLVVILYSSFEQNAPLQLKTSVGYVSRFSSLWISSETNLKILFLSL
jgi:hypothetical protein